MDSVPSTEKKEKNQIDDFDRAVRESKAATLKMYNGDPRWFSLDYFKTLGTNVDIGWLEKSNVIPDRIDRYPSYPEG